MSSRLPTHAGFAISLLGFLTAFGPACGGNLKPSNSGWRPPAACALPFDAGTCRGAIPVYASVGGVCVPMLYGGCGGNDNRFNTIEECMLVCEGRPVPNGCPAGRIAKQICLECGVVGGCGKMETVCARPCDLEADASPACDIAEPPFCIDGACQAGGCI